LEHELDGLLTLARPADMDAALRPNCAPLER